MEFMLLRVTNHPNFFGASVAILNLSVLIGFLLLSRGDYNDDWLVSQQLKVLELHQHYTRYFGFTDALMELQYHGSFYCGVDCFGTGCMDLSPAEFRLRQHKFKPGEYWIGSSQI